MWYFEREVAPVATQTINVKRETLNEKVGLESLHRGGAGSSEQVQKGSVYGTQNAPLRNEIAEAIEKDFADVIVSY